MPFGKKSEHGWIPCVAVSIMETLLLNSLKILNLIATNNKIVLHSFRNSADHDDGLWGQPNIYLQQFSSTVPNTFYAGHTVPPDHFQFAPSVSPPPCRESGRESPASCVSSDEPLSQASGKRWESVLRTVQRKHNRRCHLLDLLNTNNCIDKTSENRW